MRLAIVLPIYGIAVTVHYVITVHGYGLRTNGQQLTGMKCLVCNIRINLELSDYMETNRNSIVIRGDPNEVFTLNL
ncbi:hypothetical protein SLEP1_g23574 [Rubroshorea leprosula]|uniref:Secreted protein n=1 Tax=Rubroshorea leprosula TaxID=152421 RepID=A0AAV5JNT3_9ROSI|nr:hypothetical protein SLEP1_g23574 [Rubroshorea leprosula]